jgi:hypothetical protein
MYIDIESVITILNKVINAVLQYPVLHCVYFSHMIVLHIITVHDILVLFTILF